MPSRNLALCAPLSIYQVSLSLIPALVSRYSVRISRSKIAMPLLSIYEVRPIRF